MRQAYLTSNGDGTGRLEIVIDRVRVIESKPGVYDVVNWVGKLPQKVKCGDEELQPQLVVRLFCKSHKARRFLKLKQNVRMRKLEESIHAC